LGWSLRRSKADIRISPQLHNLYQLSTSLQPSLHQPLLYQPFFSTIAPSTIAVSTMLLGSFPMSDLNFELLKELCETPGISGREERMRQVVVRELRPLTDTLEVDVMGNLVGLKRGDSKGPKVMIAAHMDEIGFMVKHIDDRGFIRLLPVGGWDPRVMVAQRVLVNGFSGETLRGTLMPAAKPIHLLTPEDASKPPKIDEFYVDLGLPGEKVKGITG